MQHATADAKLRFAEQRMAQLTLPAIGGTGSTSAVTAAAAAGPVFEAYYHPKWPSMLVTPGTVVVLLHILLIQLRCKHAPGSSSLRTNPPQQGAATSLVRYGELFKEAARMRGYADTPDVHIGLYLQGLSDPELRQLHRAQ